MQKKSQFTELMPEKFNLLNVKKKEAPNLVHILINQFFFGSKAISSDDWSENNAIMKRTSVVDYFLQQSVTKF